MGIFSLFSSKKKLPSNTLTVHPDIKDLLWIKNGNAPGRHALPAPKETVYEASGIRFTVRFERPEPSLIDMKLPVSFEHKGEIPEPGYFPSYEGLSPQQRGIYWNFLKDPYSSGISISYVFILYYGLERHLYQGDYDKAAEVIFKLRSVHKAPSFQHYSSNALMFTGLIRKRPDFIKRLYDEYSASLDGDISSYLLLLCKLGFNDPLTAEEVMDYARAFGYTNTKNIREFPDIFLQGLRDVLLAKYGYPGIYAGEYINKNNISRLETVSVPIFANWSIEERDTKVPSVCSCPALKEAVCSALKDANEYVKSYKKELKKSGKAVTPTAVKEPKPIRKFDDEKEKLLLRAVDDAEDPVALHFAYMNLHEFYYTYRDTSPDYLEASKTYALKDQNILYEARRYYIDTERSQILTYSRLNGNEPEDISKIDFCAVIPSFTRLSIIYEKEGNIEEAVKICDDAVRFYAEVGHEEELAKFIKKRERLKKKM